MKKSAVAFVMVLVSLIIFRVQFVKVAESESTFTDSFDSATLSSEWEVIDPSGGSTFDLTSNPGWLRINTTSPPDRELSDSAITAPRLMMQGISGDFTVETRVNATMNQSEVSAGILIWKDNTLFLRLDRVCITDYDDVVQQLIRFQVIGGSGISALVGPADINLTSLRIIRGGSVFTAVYSSDGINWQIVHELTFNVDDPVSVGLYVTSVNHDGAFYADFDYFNIEVKPAQSPSPSPSSSPAPTVSPSPSPTTSPTPVPTPYPSPTSTPEPTSTPCEEPQSTGQDMAGVIFALTSIIVFLGLLVYFIKRR